MKQLHLVFVFMFLLVAGLPAAFAQNRNITGKITGPDGQPVVGATVTAKGTQTATQTNSDGIFSLSVPDAIERLVVSSVGFASQEVSIAGKSNVTLTLQTSSSQLSEVVVTALG